MSKPEQNKLTGTVVLSGEIAAAVQRASEAGLTLDQIKATIDNLLGNLDD